MYTTRLAAASDKVYQLLGHGGWFSPSTPASSTTKSGHHDILVAEILLKLYELLGRLSFLFRRRCSNIFQLCPLSIYIYIANVCAHNVIVS